MAPSRHYVDTETRRRQIAGATLQTVVEDGVSRFTTRAVASRVGISEGALFRHFSSKEEMVLEAMRILDGQIDAGLVATGDAQADLEGFVRHRAAFVGRQGSVGRLIFSDELLHLAGEAGRACVQSWRRRSVDYLVERLRSLRAAGELRTDLDLSAMAMLIQGVLLTFAMRASMGQQGTDEELAVRIDEAWNTLRVVLLDA
jgi:AcrR family transcriptional regulator